MAERSKALVEKLFFAHLPIPTPPDPNRYEFSKARFSKIPLPGG